MKLFRRSNPKKSPHKLKVLCQIDGGIGDFVSALCFVEMFYKEMDCPEIDLLVLDYRIKPLLGLFGGKKPPYIREILGEIGIHWGKNARKIKKNYHLHIITHTSLVKYSLLDKPFLTKHAPNFYLIYERYQSLSQNFSALYDVAPYADHQVAQMANYLNLNRKGFLGYSSCLPITNDSYTMLLIDPEKIKLIENLSLKPKEYVTIHSGYDSSNVYSVSSAQDSPTSKKAAPTVLSTKEWPQNRFQSLVQKIKLKYPHLKVVNIMGPNSKKMGEADLNFQGNLEEITVLLKNCLCHIDGESGLVRIARELNSKSVVIFGPTNFDFFKFEENINLKPSVCGNCFWLDLLWLKKCMKGYQTPACTDSITVDQVFNTFTYHYAKLSQKYPLELRALHFYGEEKAASNSEHLRKIFKSADLNPVPITQHTESSHRLSIYASRQWEYGFAAEQITKLKSLKLNTLKCANIGDSKGAFSSYIASLGLELDQYDPASSNPLQNFEDDSAYFKLGREKHFNAHYGSIYNIPCPTNTYDFVTCFSTLEFLEHKSYALEELLRILKPNGQLLLTFALSYKLDHEKIEGAEALNLDSVQSLLKAVGLDFDTSSLFKRLAKSAQVIQEEKVYGVPQGLTVASLILEKLPIQEDKTIETSRSLSEALAKRS